MFIISFSVITSSTGNVGHSLGSVHHGTSQGNPKSELMKIANAIHLHTSQQNLLWTTKNLTDIFVSFLKSTPETFGSL
jgi:hypothetical protein